MTTGRLERVNCSDPTGVRGAIGPPSFWLAMLLTVNQVSTASTKENSFSQKSSRKSLRNKGII